MTTPEEQAAIDQFLRDIAGIGAAAVEEGKSAIEGIVAHFQDPLGDESGGIISDVAGDLLKSGASINDAELFGWGSELDQGMRGPVDPSTGLPTDKLFARSEFTDPQPQGNVPPAVHVLSSTKIPQAIHPSDNTQAQTTQKKIKTNVALVDADPEEMFSFIYPNIHFPSNLRQKWPKIA